MEQDSILKHLEQFHSQCIHAAKLASEYYAKDPENIDNIVVTGVGNSALPGDLLKSYLNIKKAVYVNRGYRIPEFVGPRSLVFVISYSGETEETIDAYRSSLSRKAQVICITSGGKLGQLCRINNTEQILIPKGIPQRLALGYMFIPMLKVLENSGLCDLSDEIEKTAKTLKSPMFKNKALELADRLLKKIPLIYTSSKFKSIGLRWKYMLNETAKTLAFTGEFPDMNYNEINGFSQPQGDFEVLIINEDTDYSKVKKHMKIAKDIIKKKVRVTEIAITGDCQLSKIFSTIHLGDWTAYILARKLGIDPVKAEYSDSIRESLKK